MLIDSMNLIMHLDVKLQVKLVNLHHSLLMAIYKKRKHYMIDF